MPAKKSTKRVKTKTTEPISGAEITDVGLWHGARLQALLTDCAISGLTTEKIAKKYKISREWLWKIRKENTEAIAKLQANFFDEHKGKVMQALIESATGPRVTTSTGAECVQAPNPMSMKMFFDLQGSLSMNEDADPYRMYDTYWPLRKQAEFIYSGDPLGQLTTNFLISGIAYGKTKAICEKAIILARRNRKRIGMIAAPTYKMLEHPILEYLFERLNELNIKYQHRKSSGELILWGDTTILLRSAEDPDNLRGPTLAWICGDELRNWDKAAYDICLGRIRDPQAKDRQFAGTTTPDGYNWLYDLVAGPDAEKREGKTQVIYAKTADNVFLPLDFIEHVRNTYDAEFAEQELEGKFLHVGKGLIYHGFNRSTHIKDSVKYDPKLPVWIGQDFNVSPMATVLMQPHKRADGLTEVHIFDELSIRNANIQDTIKALAEMGFAPSKGEITVYPDASGANRSATAEKSSTQQLKDAGYDINPGRGNPFIRDRYAAVNGKLKNANGVATLFVHPRCKKLIEDFEREAYKEGSPIRESVRDGAKERGHHSDALGYVIHANFRIESGFTPQRLS